MGCSDFIILTQFSDTIYWYNLQCTAASRTVFIQLLLLFSNMLEKMSLL